MPDGIGRRVSRMARFQQSLRRLAMGDEAWNGAVRTLVGCVTSGTGTRRSADGI
jgi:hypothetical protein